MVEKRIVEAGGISTSVTIREGRDTPLICVPAHSMSKECFLGLFENLHLKDRTLICYDFPGHGGSSRPSDPERGYGINAYRDHLMALMEELGYKEYGLLGISLGGHVALRVAPRARVTDLHMVGVPPLVHVSDVTKAFPLTNNDISLLDEHIPPENARWLAEFFTDDEEQRQVIIDTIPKADPAARKWLVANFTLTELGNEQAILEGLSIPWTLYYGEFDHTVYPEYIENLPESFQPHIHYLKGEKHMYHWERFQPR